MSNGLISKMPPKTKLFYMEKIISLQNVNKQYLFVIIKMYLSMDKITLAIISQKNIQMVSKPCYFKKLILLVIKYMPKDTYIAYSGQR